ncbi:hypothetical protein AAMO2058_000489000 [Amorphochlora amoebiformis]
MMDATRVVRALVWLALGSRIVDAVWSKKYGSMAYEVEVNRLAEGTEYSLYNTADLVCPTKTMMLSIHASDRYAKFRGTPGECECKIVQGCGDDFPCCTRKVIPEWYTCPSRRQVLSAPANIRHIAFLGETCYKSCCSGCPMKTGCGKDVPCCLKKVRPGWLLRGYTREGDQCHGDMLFNQVAYKHEVILEARSEEPSALIIERCLQECERANDFMNKTVPCTGVDISSDHKCVLHFMQIDATTQTGALSVEKPFGCYKSNVAAVSALLAKGNPGLNMEKTRFSYTGAGACVPLIGSTSKVLEFSLVGNSSELHVRKCSDISLNTRGARGFQIIKGKCLVFLERLKNHVKIEQYERPYGCYSLFDSGISGFSWRRFSNTSRYAYQLQLKSAVDGRFTEWSGGWKPDNSKIMAADVVLCPHSLLKGIDIRRRSNKKNSVYEFRAQCDANIQSTWSVDPRAGDDFEVMTMGSVGCGESHVYSVSTTRRFVNGVDSYDFSVGCLSDSMSVWIDDADGEPLETEAVLVERPATDSPSHTPTACPTSSPTPTPTVSPTKYPTPYLKRISPKSLSNFPPPLVLSEKRASKPTPQPTFQTIPMDNYTVLVGGRVFRLLTTPLSKTDAITKCRRYGMYLASVHSQKENQALVQKLLKYKKITLIGIQPVGAGWEWHDGSPLDFVQFETPKRVAGLPDCAVFTTKGTWIPQVCNNVKHQFWCSTKPQPGDFNTISADDVEMIQQPNSPVPGKNVEKEIQMITRVVDAPQTAASPVERKQVSGNENVAIAASNRTRMAVPFDIYTVLLGKRLFRFIKEMLPKDKARTRCKQYGLDLASVHSDEENKALSKVCSDIGYGGMLGAEPDANGNWNWIDGSVFNYDKWNSKAVGSCMHITSVRDYWNTHECQYAMFFWCATPVAGFSFIEQEPDLKKGSVSKDFSNSKKSLVQTFNSESNRFR